MVNLFDLTHYSIRPYSLAGEKLLINAKETNLFSVGYSLLIKQSFDKRLEALASTENLNTNQAMLNFDLYHRC